MAQQAEQQTAAGGRRGGGGGRGRGPYDPEVVRITSNENPMGPCKEGLEALIKVAPMGWRYSPQGDNLEFNSLLASTENVPQDHVIAFPGSSIPLANSAAAFTSPNRAWVMGSPGYGSGAGRWIGAKTVKVPLRKDYSHDVEAMIKADPNAGAYYICNPNNPTGTLTPRKDLEYILANKKKDAVLIIDEAYAHFSGPENMSTDLVKADKDVVVLRTFSKIYGMAGLRAGAAYGRPDLIDKVRQFGGSGFMPVTATACAAASMKVGPSLMKERLEINKKNRDLAFEQLEKLGVTYIPSGTNFFMMQVKGMTGQQVGTAMAAKKVQIGRVWQEWPQMVRVTVGSYEEMGKFNAALAAVVKEGPPTQAKA
jgi:histidinol-phosphate aminotransferase